MIKIVSVSLENEMDLVLAHRRSLKVAELLGLTIATQTTFATAVSELARAVMDRTDSGRLEIALQKQQDRYYLQATITYNSSVLFTNADKGFYFAQKLVPEFNLIKTPKYNRVEMKIGLPRSLKLSGEKIQHISSFFESVVPENAYEEIKLRNTRLRDLAVEQEDELRRSKIVNDLKTEFISVASHEIKTPITVLKAYTQIAMGMKEHCDDEMRGLLAKIDMQTNKLLALVEQLLDVSRMENGNLQYNKQPEDFNSFLTATTNLVRHVLTDHTLTTTFGGSFTVMMDQLRMEQVFSNLIGNAAKYSKKNSTIHLQCSAADDGFLQVAITDQGIGMSAANRETIFEKFYRAKDVLKTHTGLGMGLYITSKIVADHGGRIWVESTEGRGSTFFFTLPTLQTEALHSIEVWPSQAEGHWLSGRSEHPELKPESVSANDPGV